MVLTQGTTFRALSVILLLGLAGPTNAGFASESTAAVLQSKAVVSRPQTVTTPNMDKWIGTWILNPQKSTYGSEKAPGPAAPKQILKIRIEDGILDLYSRMEMADGTDVADETHLVDLNGKPHVTEFDGFKPATETFRQIDKNTFEIALKARPTEVLDVPDGELTVKVRFTMSADGNTISEIKQYDYKEFAAAGKKTNGSGSNPAEGSKLVFD